MADFRVGQIWIQIKVIRKKAIRYAHNRHNDNRKPENVARPTRPG